MLGTPLFSRAESAEPRVMVSQLSKPEATDVFYPDCDDQPMASNTEQYQWIVTIRENLNWLLDDAFVAGDLFWYPVKGRSDISVAPDVMVALGRPKGKRLSYKQWEENGQAPQVVFEIISPSNTRKEMEQKLLFFERHGVDEYYLYDTEKLSLDGFLRGDFELEHIADMSDWVSPLLNIRFDMSAGELVLQRPDGSPFLSYEAVIENAELAKQEAQSAKEEAQSAKQEAQSAKEEAQSAKQEAQSAKEKAAKLAAKLKELGIDPEQV